MIKNNRKSADHFCIICGQWIGNHDTGATPYGKKSYYSIIRAKYCDECRPMIIDQQMNIRLHNLRQRQKYERRELKEKLSLTQEENELLRKRVMQLNALVYGSKD
ncbi:hypothetical protein [Ruminococcus sp. XPD3002]|uniref:hypothetical protein n=1 Tax=Ruminococcus sp. XPD3002 TaxID=1452269 RepID=UPI00091DD3C1|nr:hypothetical protein SAMN04487832_109137 [Ruminococcus flavefaciens]